MSDNGNLLIQVLKGGLGSGDFGHTGRAGKRGGSGGGGGKGKPRKGRRSREALNKEIEAGKKPKVDVATFDDKVRNARKISGEWNDNDIHREYEEWSSDVNIIDNQKPTLHRYTGTDLHKEINDHLRGIRSDASNDDAIKELDNALAHAPKLSEDTTLYRSASGVVLKNLRPGDEFIDKGFGSTSINEKVADDFADDFGGGDVKMTILAPKGSKGAYIADFSSDWPEESEFLLPRNAKFRVMKSVHTPNELRPWHIQLEYIGTQ